MKARDLANASVDVAWDLLQALAMSLSPWKVADLCASTRR